MKYTTKKKLLTNDYKEVEEKSYSILDESKLIFVFVVTIIILLIMMVFQLSIICNNDEYSDEYEAAVITRDQEISSMHEMIHPSFVTNILKRDSLNKLIFVSYHKVNSSQRVKICPVENGNEIFANCSEIALKNEYNMFIPPRAEMLGNGKIVLSFIWKKKVSPKEKTEGLFTIQVVDLNETNSTNKEFRGPYDDEILRSFDPFQIIPYQNKFDVFVKSNEYCSPPGSICIVRYDDQGKWLGTFDFHFETRHNAFPLEKMYPIKKFDSTKGYVYISMQNSTIKILNQFLEVEIEKKTLGFITTYAVTDGHVGICTRPNRLHPYVTCSKLDSELKIKEEYLLENSPFFYGWSLFGLSDGSFLAAAISKKAPLSFKLRRLMADKTVSRLESFTNLDCDYHLNPLIQFNEYQGSYCFSCRCAQSTRTYCIDSKKSTNLTISDSFSILRSA